MDLYSFLSIKSESEDNYGKLSDYVKVQQEHIRFSPYRRPPDQRPNNVALTSCVYQEQVFFIILSSEGSKSSLLKTIINNYPSSTQSERRYMDVVWTLIRLRNVKKDVTTTLFWRRVVGMDIVDFPSYNLLYFLFLHTRFLSLWSGWGWSFLFFKEFEPHNSLLIPHF